MKSILMSIKPKYCELIANGSKTIEVRKTRPRIDEPFKVYIYETKGSPRYLLCGGKRVKKPRYDGRGQVIGEFVCDKIECFTTDYRADKVQTERIAKQSCLMLDELAEYEYNSNCLYGYHISDLKIYDKPKELGELTTTKLEFLYKTDEPAKYYNRIAKRITRPPQSWCYVEGLE